MARISNGVICSADELSRISNSCIGATSCQNLDTRCSRGILYATPSYNSRDPGPFMYDAVILPSMIPLKHGFRNAGLLFSISTIGESFANPCSMTEAKKYLSLRMVSMALRTTIGGWKGLSQPRNSKERLSKQGSRLMSWDASSVANQNKFTPPEPPCKWIA